VTRPRWFSPVALVLVILGGMIGVAIRAAVVVPLGAVNPHPLVVPAVTLVINLVGSLLLGVIVGWFADRHPRARLFLGTGVMGGFTTYSAFAVQTLDLERLALHRHHPRRGLAVRRCLRRRRRTGGRAAHRRPSRRDRTPEDAE
jgi:protein CrcB